jgi:hypothetical protein
LWQHGHVVYGAMATGLAASNLQKKKSATTSELAVG